MDVPDIQEALDCLQLCDDGTVFLVRVVQSGADLAGRRLSCPALPPFPASDEGAINGCGNR